MPTDQGTFGAVFLAGVGVECAGMAAEATAMKDGTAGIASEGSAPVSKKRQPRRKAAKAMAKAEALSTAGADALAELSTLQRLVGQLVQGLTAMQDTQATHTEMLARLLAAATAPTEPEGNVTVLLQAVVSRLTEQGALLRSLDKTMAKLPEDVGTAVGSQMANALAAVR